MATSSALTKGRRRKNCRGKQRRVFREVHGFVSARKQAKRTMRRAYKRQRQRAAWQAGYQTAIAVHEGAASPLRRECFDSKSPVWKRGYHCGELEAQAAKPFLEPIGACA